MRIVWHCCLYMIMLGQMLVAVDRVMLSARFKYDWYDHCVTSLHNINSYTLCSFFFVVLKRFF